MSEPVMVPNWIVLLVGKLQLEMARLERENAELRAALEPDEPSEP